MDDEVRKVTDMAGNELAVGDTICFTISMRIDNKPLVRAKVVEVICGKKPDFSGHYNDWLVVEYIDSPAVAWGRTEKKLPKKISAHRVVKCY